MGKWNGGMGPQTIISRLEIDIKNKNDRKELLSDFRGGIEFGCPKCGEAFKIGSDAEVEDVRELQRWLADENCPYCNDGSVQYGIRLIENNMHHANIPHNFKIENENEEVEFHCIRLGNK